MLNCKQGELAIIGGDEPAENIGKLVHIAEPGDDWSDIGDSRPHWAVDTLGQHISFAPYPGHSDGVELVDIADSCLTPIRGGEGTDEMIRIAGLPKKEGVKV
jgi:hypothetical protein